jgi:hypothetical protein
VVWKFTGEGVIFKEATTMNEVSRETSELDKSRSDLIAEECHADQWEK